MTARTTMIMEKPLEIVLVDDHKILMDGVEALLILNEKYRIKAKEESGIALLGRSDIDSIDLVIMDINMKDKDGIETLVELKDFGFSGKCIFLSSHNDLKLVNEAIHFGGSAYVTKNSATEYLEDAIEKVLEGETYYSPDIRERILKAFSNGKNNSSSNNDIERSVLRQLTERELEVLKLIAMQHTSEEIAQKLYIAKSTVDTHRKNLIYKLKVKNAVGLGLFAERNGLI